ncbi:6-bladed beta-propeller protein [Pedobacter steynii]|uniref:6-bladed beta-propeller protein n=1 Tax=Pedobacter steynii TaxID=430522 RepID=A0A1H0J7G3_9SPHI|nr:6-bladed beta-propeller [Pedobacter steynii]NQX43055.1 6-bladed beta-propeller [Pedobacter steynii]SDO39738.1 6-bladed beta-propeller protein [Pedobacter steynii]
MLKTRCSLLFYNYKTTVFIVVTLLICNSGNSLFGQTASVDTSHIKILRIDPENANGTTVSKLFEKVNFIPLETSKDSFFSDIDRLETTSKYFVILDISTGSILIFNKTGKFYKKVSGSKIRTDAGLNASYRVGKMELTDDKESPLIQVSVGDYSLFYNLECQLVRKESSKLPPRSRMHRFSEGTLFQTNYPTKDSTCYGLVSFKANKILNSYFPYQKNQYKNSEFIADIDARLNNSYIDNELFFTRRFDYQIYKATPQSLTVEYRVVFPAMYHLPVDFEQTALTIKEMPQEYFRNDQKLAGVSDVLKIDSKLFFRLAEYGKSSYHDAFIYDLKAENLISISHIEPDSLSSFLPVTDLNERNGFSNSNFDFFDGNYLYTHFSAYAFFKMKELNDNKNITYNPELIRFFDKESRKSNPIIVELKPIKN